MLEKIAKQTFRASEIVNSLLNFSRTSTTDFGDVNLNRVIQETLSLLEHQLQKAGIADQDAIWIRTLPPVHGNAGKLQQVFLNLFLNARDAMDARRRAGSAHLGARTSGARVDVTDTGHGIAPEHLHRIYDPFFTTKGAAQRHRPRSFGDLRYHSGAWRLDRSLQPARRRRHVPPGTSAGPSPGSARKPVNRRMK